MVAPPPRVLGAPLWSVLALLITVAWAIAAAPEPPCTDAAPCGADWPGMVEMGLAVGLLYWLARLPELTLVAAPVLAAVVARVELPDAEPNSLAANLCVLAALGFGWAAACERVAARRRQRDLVERAAGVRHPLPGPVAPCGAERSRSRRGWCSSPSPPSAWFRGSRASGTTGSTRTARSPPWRG